MNGRVTLGRARKVFAEIAPDQATCEANACASLERTRYWNWFRMGIDLAQRGRVKKTDVAWVRTSPRLKDLEVGK